jgi:L-cysteine S-thiosulfotransferase
MRPSLRCLAALAMLTLHLLWMGSGHAQGVSKARRSGADFMSPDLQAMQRDESLNPGMLWVKQGADLWQSTADQNPNATPSKITASTRSCASCHGDATHTMRGVATRYPAFDATSQRPINLAQRINLCRVNQQQASAWRAESAELLALESYIAHQSRGLPITPPSDARLQPFIDQGQQRYMQRMGQLNLSCAQCHDERAGLRLGGNLIPQAHPTAYPVYRLEWQGVGSLQRRLRNCMSGVRSQAYPFGAQELVELELYLAAQARGMALESPGVRP